MKKKLILFLIVSSFCAGAFAEKVKILKIEAKRIGAFDEVAVYTSRNIKPDVILLESPNRIALSFPDSRIDEPITIAGSSPNIRIIQAAQFDENTVYVIVEPNEKLAYEYTSMIGKNKVLLELTAAKPGSKNIIAPSLGEAEILPIMEEATQEIYETVLVMREAALITEETITAEKIVIKEKKTPPSPKKARKVTIEPVAQPLLGRTIVIDPGHGGKDPGYVGKYGTFEKHLTYKVALKLKRMLREAGANVFLTRYSDISIKNGEIVNIANNRNADIFVAIHFNSFTNPRTAGCETFYFTPQSRKFASVMQRSLCRTIKRRDRGVKRDIYYTIHHTKMPSVLVEPVYLTNPKEEKMILKPAFQEVVAYGIYKGIKEYVKMSP